MRSNPAPSNTVAPKTPNTVAPTVAGPSKQSGAGIGGQQRDADAGRRDAVADARDDVAERRDADGVQRDVAAERHDVNAAVRDLTGDRRDHGGGARDSAAAGRDEFASQRDADADRRDDAADHRELATLAFSRTTGRGVCSACTASARPTSSREALTQQRREQAASDRRFAREDRRAATVERTGAALDRATALADRVVGAATRGGSRLDRGTAFDDRASSADDRRSAAEFAAIELKIADSKARAWRLLQAVLDPVTVISGEAVIELINVHAVALFGYQPEELIGQPVQRLILAGLDDTPVARQGIDLEPLLPNSAGTVAVCKDGSAVPVQVSLGAIRLSTGQAVLVRVCDLSDRELVKAEWQISNERFRVSFGSAPIRMALIDLHVESPGHLLLVYVAFCELTGYTEQELLAGTSVAITHPDDRAETVANVARLADGSAERWCTEKRYRRASGPDEQHHRSPFGLDLLERKHSQGWAQPDRRVPSDRRPPRSGASRPRGIDVLRALRADPRTKQVPVAVLSAAARPSQIGRDLAAGGGSYLTKPLNVREFLQFLESHAPTHARSAPMLTP